MGEQMGRKINKIENFTEKVKNLAMELRAGVCPVWQCGGELEYLEERTNWQEPDLKCNNCGAEWRLYTDCNGKKVSEIIKNQN